MKQLTRGYVWWPGLNKQLYKHFNSCEQSAKFPASVSPASWLWPVIGGGEREGGGGLESFSRRLFAGPNRGKMFLVVIDAYSKFLEVSSVYVTTQLLP